MFLKVLKMFTELFMDELETFTYLALNCMKKTTTKLCSRLEFIY